MPYLAAGSAVGVTGTLTVGYVLWTIRSGLLTASMLAQMPAWALVDPLVVLDYLDGNESSSKKKEDEEDDSLESMLERSEADADESSETGTGKQRALHYPIT
jgi:hypothetical protein